MIDLTEENENTNKVPALGSREEEAVNVGASTSAGFGQHPSRGQTPAVPTRGGFGQGGWRGRSRGSWRGNWGGGGGRGGWGRGRGRGMFQVRTRNEIKYENNERKNGKENNGKFMNFRGLSGLRRWMRVRMRRRSCVTRWRRIC